MNIWLLISLFFFVFFLLVEKNFIIHKTKNKNDVNFFFLHIISSLLNLSYNESYRLIKNWLKILKTKMQKKTQKKFRTFLSNNFWCAKEKMVSKKRRSIYTLSTEVLVYFARYIFFENGSLSSEAKEELYFYRLSVLWFFM